MAYDILIFFIFVIILLGMIWALFLILKNGLNSEDSSRIDVKKDSQGAEVRVKAEI